MPFLLQLYTLPDRIVVQIPDAVTETGVHHCPHLVRKQFNTIKKLFSLADCIINCGDARQEGELIQRWVMQQANDVQDTNVC